MNKQKSLVDNIILMKEWNYEKNGILKPNKFFPNAHKKVWWKCPNCNYEWYLRITDMVKKKYKCLKCKRSQ